MADDEVTKSARLTSDEAKVLDDQNISFTDLVRDAISNKKKGAKAHSKKELVNKLMTNGVFAIIGLAFLTALNFSSNLFTVCIVGGLGAVFLIYGSINLYLTIKEVNLVNRK